MRLHLDSGLLMMPREQMPDSAEAHVALARQCTFGTVYEFLHAGDPLREHDHKDGISHLTIVAAGGVRILSPTRDEELWAPAVIDCPDGERHAFVALADHSVIVNVPHG